MPTPLYLTARLFCCVAFAQLLKKAGAVAGLCNLVPWIKVLFFVSTATMPTPRYLMAKLVRYVAFTQLLNQEYKWAANAFHAMEAALEQGEV